MHFTRPPAWGNRAPFDFHRVPRIAHAASFGADHQPLPRAQLPQVEMPMARYAPVGKRRATANVAASGVGFHARHGRGRKQRRVNEGNEMGSLNLGVGFLSRELP